MLKYGMPLIAALALTLSLLSVQRMTPKVVRAEPLAAPATAAFTQQIGAVGIVEASTENIAVNLPVPGLVTQVAVRAGDIVRKGQILFQLDDRDLQAELNLRRSTLEVARTRLLRLEQSPRPEEIPPAEARVAEAKSLLGDALVQLRVLEAVKDPRAIRQEDLLRRRRAVESAEARVREAQASLDLLKSGAWKADLEVARAEIRQAEAQIARIEADISRLKVTAPMNGVILQCKVRPGEYAQAGVLAQPLILMGGLAQKHVRADIDEKDAWRFRAGAQAIGSVRGNGTQTFSLTYVRTEPYVIPKKSLTGDATERVDTRVLQVIYALPGGSPLYVGQQMDLSIEAANQ
ncbi:biotin/lipoyl-binding protein [Oscillatoria amoena NRMC-F 0135]|nr:biotin/lipoyl-binding protein [Oscillatoria amoena NRMC-F 0135]